jgi:hypothetical protein
MICPHCKAVNIVATSTDNLEIGQLNCGNCHRMIKRLSNAEISQLSFNPRIYSDTASTLFWGELIELLPSTEYDILANSVSFVGLFGNILTIVVMRSDDDIAFVDLISAIPSFSRILFGLLGEIIEVRLSSHSEWIHAVECSIQQFPSINKNAVPPEYIFLFYYCEVIDTEVGSNTWIFHEIDMLMKIAYKNNYPPGWILSTLYSRYWLTLDQFNYLGDKLNYGSDWGILAHKNQESSRFCDD